MRGGARSGAGRKKGSVTKATVYRQEMLAKAAAEGVSPLEVMMTAMREAWEKNDRERAVQIAEKAAPYMHAKLAAVEMSGSLNVSHDDALDEIESAIDQQETNGVSH